MALGSTHPKTVPYTVFGLRWRINLLTVSARDCSSASSEVKSLVVILSVKGRRRCSAGNCAASIESSTHIEAAGQRTGRNCFATLIHWAARELLPCKWHLNELC